MNVLLMKSDFESLKEEIQCECNLWVIIKQIIIFTSQMTFDNTFSKNRQ